MAGRSKGLPHGKASLLKGFWDGGNAANDTVPPCNCQRQFP
jgi:hypothetical protein